MVLGELCLSVYLFELGSIAFDHSSWGTLLTFMALEMATAITIDNDLRGTGFNEWAFTIFLCLSFAPS